MMRMSIFDDVVDVAKKVWIWKTVEEVDETVSF